MNTELDEVIRSAFADILDATSPLDPTPPKVGINVLDRADRSIGSRRLVAVASVALVVAGIVALTAIAQRSPSEQTVAGGSVDLGSVDRFPVGSITSIDDPAVFVVNDPPDGVVVFDAHSTHRGCVLVVNDEQTDPAVHSGDPNVAFVDPCHGSTFDRFGDKVAGPAPRALDRYRVDVTDGRIVVDLSQRLEGDPARVPDYDGADLDTTLPVVGRGWFDTMEFSLSADTNARLYNVLQQAIAVCMNERGFADYRPVPFPPNGNYQDRVNPLDRAYAAVMGYHALPADPVDPNPDTEEYGEALSGAMGCGDPAYDATFGQIRSYTDLNDALRSRLAAAIDGFTDSEAGATVEAAWSACMSEQGRPFDSRLDAILTYVDEPQVTDEEIRTRLVDLDCDVAVGYTATQHEWEQARVDDWIAREQAAIRDAVAERSDVDAQLIEMEITYFGAVRSPTS